MCKKLILKFLINSDQHLWTGIQGDRCNMRNHDFVSDGFLALTAASLVLLCSSLLAIAFS